ncbi:sigma factor [Streptosporangium sp. DT93]|uniref:sigma factor n=1 Tax=Streptosporangium sp. DT93 TaxID=3393428 RepID=UPI003CEF98FF
MIDSVLVETLRAREPGALVALYDAYAEGVYRYCRSVLATSEDAQAAFLDTLVAAEAHVHALTDPRRLEAWLYALARRECLRRVPAGAPETPVPAPEITGGDADLRVMAWNATRSLSPGDREVLDLSCRHGFGPLDLGAVLGVSAKAAGALYESARERLRDVVTAEVLVRKGPYDCAGRARLPAGFGGELTPEARERVIRHVNRCDTCAPHRVRQVSAAKVFDLLPVAPLPPALRTRVMDCFSDPGRVPYRREVAQRAAPLDGAGFPEVRSPRGRRGSRVAAGAAVAIAAAAAIALVVVQAVADPAGIRSGVASGGSPAVVEPPSGHRPWEPGRQGTALTPDRAGGGVAVELVGSLGSARSRDDTGAGPGDGPRPPDHDRTGEATGERTGDRAGERIEDRAGEATGEGAEDRAGERGEDPMEAPSERGPRNPAEPPPDGPGETSRPPGDGPADRPGGPLRPPSVEPPSPRLPHPPPVPPSSGTGTPDGRHAGRLPHRRHQGHRPPRLCAPAATPAGRSDAPGRGPGSSRAERTSPARTSPSRTSPSRTSPSRTSPADGTRRWRPGPDRPHDGSRPASGGHRPRPEAADSPDTGSGRRENAGPPTPTGADRGRHLPGPVGAEEPVHDGPLGEAPRADGQRNR